MSNNTLFKQNDFLFLVKTGELCNISMRHSICYIIDSDSKEKSTKCHILSQGVDNSMSPISLLSLVHEKVMDYSRSFCLC